MYRVKCHKGSIQGDKSRIQQSTCYLKIYLKYKINLLKKKKREREKALKSTNFSSTCSMTHQHAQHKHKSSSPLRSNYGQMQSVFTACYISKQKLRKNRTIYDIVFASQHQGNYPRSELLLNLRHKIHAA